MILLNVKIEIRDFGHINLIETLSKIFLNSFRKFNEYRIILFSFLFCFLSSTLTNFVCTPRCNLLRFQHTMFARLESKKRKREEKKEDIQLDNEFQL